LTKNIFCDIIIIRGKEVKKVFNDIRVKNLFKKYNSINYFKDISIEDIKSKKVFKKIKL